MLLLFEQTSPKFATRLTSYHVQVVVALSIMIQHDPTMPYHVLLAEADFIICLLKRPKGSAAARIVFTIRNNTLPQRLPLLVSWSAHPEVFTACNNVVVELEILLRLTSPDS